jgi:hypothetical protein
MRNNKNLIEIFLLIFFLLINNFLPLIKPVRAASVIYADYSVGNDTTGNGTSGNPYKTFHKAYTMATNGDTIDLTGTFDWTNADETGDAATSGYTIAKSLTIQGQSADATFVQAASTPYTADRRIFTLNAAVTLQRLTIRYGQTSGDWVESAIDTWSALTILDSVITENANTTRFGGAAIGVNGSGKFIMRNSTVSNNNRLYDWYGYTGGIGFEGTNTGNEITNCTFYNNIGAYNGAIYGGGTLTVTNSTFVNNRGSTSGADIHAWSSGRFYVKNNIFANGVGYNLAVGAGGQFIDGGYNIVETQSGAGFVNGVNGNLVGNQVNLNVDAALALNSTSNGVPTLALLTGSVAINAGDPNDYANNGVNVPVADQRVYYRSGRTDMGAFEYGGSSSYSRPTVQTSNLTASSVSYNQMNLSWTNGDGMRRVIFAKQANSGTTSPSDSVSYTASATFGSGTQIGSTGWYAIYNGSGTSLTLTGLTRSTDYIFQAFEYSGTTGSELYFTDTATNNPLTQATTAVPQPTTQATNLTFSSVAYTSMTVGWTNGNGATGRVVFAKQSNSGTASPVDDTTYTASTTFGSGTQIGATGWYTIYKGTGSSVSVTGLVAQTDYIFQVFEYNGTAGIENYLTDTSTNNPLLQASATVTEPTTQASNLTFSSVNYTSMTVSWTNGNSSSSRRVVFAKQANTGTTSPVDNATYSASTTFGSGTQIGTSGWYTVYNSSGTSVTVTGLTAQTDYIFQVFEYNFSGSIYNYNTNTGTNNPRSQASATVNEPATQASNITFSSVAAGQMTISWTNGNGAARVVFVKQADSGSAEPVDNTAYTANAAFGSGTQIGTSGWYNVYNSTGTSVTVTRLLANTTYSVSVLEYNSSGAIYNYKLDTAINNPKIQATALIPASVALGSGTSVTTTSTASPINITYKSTHSQTVYTAAELNTAGAGGGASITQVGFYVNAAPTLALTNFVIRMKHTSDTTVANWQTASGLTTNYSVASYTPTAGGFDMITLSTPFTWNGVDNIVVDTSFGLLASTSNSGTIRYYSLSNGFRYLQSSTSDQTNTFTGGSTSSYKPQIQFSFQAPTYTLTYTAGANGSITGISPQTVSYGTSGSAVTAVPATGYHFVNWSDASTQNPRTDTNVTQAVNVTANFAINTFTLSYTAGLGGSISGILSQIVNYLASGTMVEAVASTGYHFVNWSDNNLICTRTDSNVTDNISVTANFEIDTHTVTYTAGAHGSISGDASQTVNYGADATAVEAVPDTGYYFTTWSDLLGDNPRTDTNITNDLSVSAVFNPYTYTLRYANGPAGPETNFHGSVAGDTDQTVEYGTSGSTVTAIPDTGYHFVDWSDESTENPRADTNVSANISVYANFAINTYTLTYSAGTGGSILGTASQTLNYNENGTEVTAIAIPGYTFSRWSDNITSNPRIDLNVASDISVSAIFSTIGGGGGGGSGNDNSDEETGENEEMDSLETTEEEQQNEQIQTAISLVTSNSLRDLAENMQKTVELNRGTSQNNLSNENGDHVSNLVLQMLINGEPVRFTKVYLFSKVKEGVTDENGYVTFYDVPLGEHTIKLSYNNKTYENKISLKEQKSEINLTVHAEEKTLNYWWLLFIIPFILVMFVVINRWFLKRKYRNIR